MRKFTLNFIFFLPLIILAILFELFVYHPVFVGGDELRMTYVASEIGHRKAMYFTDPNNDLYNTNIFVKSGFSINAKKVIYPVGFTLNSLVLVPILSIFPEYPVQIFNLFALSCFLLSFFIIYKIFCNLGLRIPISIVGATIFSITNYNLAIYVSYYPDFLLLLLVLTLIYSFIKFDKTKSLRYLYCLVIISSFSLAYKVTMYPVLFTFLPLYGIFLMLKKEIKILSIISISIVFVTSFVLFNLPQFITNTIGPTYSDLNISTETSIGTMSKSSQSSNNSIESKAIKLSYRFYQDFLLPKNHGSILLWHLEHDLYFFSINNMIVLFGFFLCTIYLFKTNKALFLMVGLLFITSFILWGNMNFYGGGPPDLTNLRNTHTRYMLPIITIFYILGFYYLEKAVKNKLLLIMLLFLFVVRIITSLLFDYPFSYYSLINKNGYFYDFTNERIAIVKLQIPRDSVFISAAYDDGDLGYYFNNYADFKRLSDSPIKMHTMIKEFLHKGNKRVYLLFPISDSRFNPISQEDLISLYSYIQSNFKYKVLFEDHYKKLLQISKS